MDRISRLLVTGCCMALLSFPLIAGSVDLSAEEKSQGFELLFNGENLDGWIIQGLEGEKPSIENNILKMDGWDWWAIISKKKFRNFTLRCEVLIEKDGNTGILFHTPEKEVFITSPEIQLCDDAGQEPSKKSSGAIFNVLAPKKNAIKPAGEWNTVEITVKDNHLTVILNGETVQDTDIEGLEGIKHKRQEGGIAFQHKSFKHKAAFRNIRVKSL